MVRSGGNVEQQLIGKRALVTGASRGIGRGIALELAQAGADIAVAYRRQKEAACAVVKEIEALGRRALAAAADVRDAQAMEEMVQSVARELGGLDIVVANAGVPTRFEPTQDVDPGYWERVISIDLTGAFHTLRAALPILREQRSGVILTVSSVAADSCAANGAAYNAAKAGLNALTKTVARENASRGIRCNIISPGLVLTDMGQALLEEHGEELIGQIPLRRGGTPEEIGKLAVYLASEAGSWITAKNFRIDGGIW